MVTTLSRLDVEGAILKPTDVGKQSIWQRESTTDNTPKRPVTGPNSVAAAAIQVSPDSSVAPVAGLAVDIVVKQVLDNLVVCNWVGAPLRFIFTVPIISRRCLQPNGFPLVG
jgi:hypothetical protein